MRYRGIEMMGRDAQLGLIGITADGMWAPCVFYVQKAVMFVANSYAMLIYQW